ncbi:MAG: class I SAM-dependent methyltransferase [Candidatus Parcubacteria bacterium]|nr:class I SAM-dependent methyltransferase [Candidatus Parcubacteria bacterium]
MVIFKKHNLTRYLRGEGIEIGALNSPLEVNRRKCQVRYVDWLDKDDLIKHNPTIPPEKIKKPDVIASAMDLGVFGDETEDFVIADQVLEHLPNPILALKEFHRVLKTGGILYLTIPDKRYTIDSERPITSLSHLIKDYEKGILFENDMSHYKEWVELVEEKRPPNSPLRWNLENILNTGCAIHFHVWTPESIIEILNYIKNDLKINFSLKDYYYRNKESPFIFILEKDASGSCPDLNVPIKERYSALRLALFRAEYTSKVFIKNNIS